MKKEGTNFYSYNKLMDLVWWRLRQHLDVRRPEVIAATELLPE